MRGRTKVLGVSIALLAMVAAGVTLAVASPDLTAARTITVTAKQVDGELVDVDGNGFDPGDLFNYRTVLYQNGEKVGYENAECGPHFPTTQKRVRFLCRAISATFLGRGQILSAGTFTMSASSAARLAKGATLAAATRSVPDITFAVTGGTGQFQNVRGEVDASFSNNRETYHLIP
jgi:hypothetical protein